jgi:hypothetical protein
MRACASLTLLLSSVCKKGPVCREWIINGLPVCDICLLLAIEALQSSADMRHTKGRNTVGEYLLYLYDADSLQPLPKWPPDVFPLCGSLLLNSGAYRHAMSDWPPSRSWTTQVARIAGRWRDNWNKRKPAPTEIRSLWARLIALSHTELSLVCKHRELCVTLLELCAIADEASFSLGIPTSTTSEDDRYYRHSAELLLGRYGATLGEKIHPCKARVLPKMHTPQSGFTESHKLGVTLSGRMAPGFSRRSIDL